LFEYEFQQLISRLIQFQEKKNTKGEKIYITKKVIQEDLYLLHSQFDFGQKVLQTFEPF